MIDSLGEGKFPKTCKRHLSVNEDKFHVPILSFVVIKNHDTRTKLKFYEFGFLGELSFNVASEFDSAKYDKFESPLYNLNI